jgi:folate-binding Fe-S cluster repair protein YgfZ
MLNYESIGGVNFKKGCYPGQEVVARSQFRGTLKRRLYTAQSLQTGWTPGVEVFVGTDASDQPSGVVVQSAPDDQGGCLLMLVLQTDAATHHADDLHGHSPQGPLLRLLPLPYELLENI